MGLTAIDAKVGVLSDDSWSGLRRPIFNLICRESRSHACSSGCCDHPVAEAVWLLQEMDIWAQLVAEKAAWRLEKAIVSRESPATPGIFTFMLG